jgi:hypothetical protein
LPCVKTLACLGYRLVFDKNSLFWEIEQQDAWLYDAGSLT